MRLIKMLGLAALAALAVTAYLASTASADRLCEEKIDDTATCPAAKVVANNAKIAGLDTDATLLNNKKETLLLCASETLGEVTKNGGVGVAVLGFITKLVFTNCKGLCTSAKGVNLPFHMETKAASLEVLVKKEGSSLGAVIEGCPFGAKCTYNATTQPTKLKFNNLEDFLIAEEVPLTLTNPGICSFFSSTGFWDAKYLLTLDPKEAEHVTPIYATSGG